MSNYLIELSVVHLVLMLAYWVFLRKERQYAIMRVYLIVAMILAVAIPLFKLPTLFNREGTIEVISAEVVSFDSEAIGSSDDASVTSTDILIIIYFAVSIFLNRIGFVITCCIFGDKIKCIAPQNFKIAVEPYH